MDELPVPVTAHDSNAAPADANRRQELNPIVAMVNPHLQRWHFHMCEKLVGVTYTPTLDDGNASPSLPALRKHISRKPQ